MKIPGLTDGNVEIIASDIYPDCFGFCNGSRVDFWELPEKVLQTIRETALSDKLAMKTFDEEGVVDERVRVEGWVWCNLGILDHIPDVDQKDLRVNLEYHDCGKRGKCPYEFRRCKRVSVNDSTLTPRETTYARFTAHDLSEKEIASRMGLKNKSMISLAQRVRIKVRVKSRAGLAAWAVKMGIA